MRYEIPVQCPGWGAYSENIYRRRIHSPPPVWRSKPSRQERLRISIWTELIWSDLIWINKSIEDDVVLDSAIWWKHKLYSFGLPTTSFSFPFLRIPLFCWSTEDDNGEGGEGGALYTGVDSTTLFQRRTVMQHNEARSGGAIYNLGYTEIESRGFMRANQALVSRHLLAA